MAEIHIDATDDAIGRQGFTFALDGKEMYKAAAAMELHHAKRMAYYHDLFMAELLRTAPKGIKIDTNEIDVGSFNLQQFATSYGYSPVVSDSVSEYRNKYIYHRAGRERMHRYAALFNRSPNKEYPLTFEDAEYFGLFSMVSPSEE